MRGFGPGDYEVLVYLARDRDRARDSFGKIGQESGVEIVEGNESYPETYDTEVYTILKDGKELGRGLMCQHYWGFFDEVVGRAKEKGVKHKDQIKIYDKGDSPGFKIYAGPLWRLKSLFK